MQRSRDNGGSILTEGESSSNSQLCFQGRCLCSVTGSGSRARHGPRVQQWGQSQWIDFRLDFGCDQMLLELPVLPVSKAWFSNLPNNGTSRWIPFQSIPFLPWSVSLLTTKNPVSKVGGFSSQRVSELHLSNSAGIYLFSDCFMSSIISFIPQNNLVPQILLVPLAQMRKQAHWNDNLWIKPRPSPGSFPFDLLGPFSIFAASTSCPSSDDWKAPAPLPLFSSFFKSLLTSSPDFLTKVSLSPLCQSLYLPPIVYLSRPPKGLYCWRMTPPSSLWLYFSLSLNKPITCHKGRLCFLLV